MTKMTRKEALSLAITALSENAEAVAIFSKMIEQIEAKSNAPRKMTKEQIENVAHKERILSAVVEGGRQMTCKEVAEIVGLTSPKVSALLTQLVNENKVGRAYEKRTAVYTAKEEVVEG